MEEPVLTFSVSRAEIKAFLDKPHDPPEFHTKSTKMCVKGAATVLGQEARYGFIGERFHHR